MPMISQRTTAEDIADTNPSLLYSDAALLMLEEQLGRRQDGFEPPTLAVVMAVLKLDALESARLEGTVQACFSALIGEAARFELRRKNSHSQPG